MTQPSHGNEIWLHKNRIHHRLADSAQVTVAHPPRTFSMIVAKFSDRACSRICGR